MDLVLILLVLLVIFAVGGFALHLLWWLAIIVLVIYLFSALSRPRGGRRFY